MNAPKFRKLYDLYNSFVFCCNRAKNTVIKIFGASYSQKCFSDIEPIKGIFKTSTLFANLKGKAQK